MAAGVTIEDPATTYIDATSTIGADTVIHPGVSLEGRTAIGAGCEIHSGRPHRRLARSATASSCCNHCVITDSHDRERRDASARSRTSDPEASIGEHANVGNFVELKKTALGRGSKANHLTYLGDATIGANVNIGAGTITCNYDGVTQAPDDRSRTARSSAATRS